ncbi:hypothetical protein LP415_11680 [Polaromonas sp. P1(28)-8]|nr:hypothetical protein LP415_11680 [Polaromonas sp. P1(28)-8]
MFASLAFGGVIFAAVMQGRALEIAGKQQLQQSFEPLFFHLLELHREVSATRFRLSARTVKPTMLTPSSANTSVDFGRAIKLLRREVRMKVSGVSASAANKAKLRLATGQIYMIFYEFNQDELGPHFRSLYHVFKLIEKSAFDEATKIKYANCGGLI